MATPAIQTLLSDAQQVLNLNSISEVRSTMAVALANANVGTPLSPSLTTQQLWDEFYQVVRQPESDIESILANQLMKFLYAPPAPGGAGADKQVIFNDGGVLAGSANFLFNKATNLLTVTGSATITGALTVDTSTLNVDATNHRVGIGTASPATRFVVSGGRTGLFSGDAFSLALGQTTGQANYLYLGTDASGTLLVSESSGNSVMTLSQSGVCTWLDGAGGTRMTLNSTGLGIAGSPVSGNKLFVEGSAQIGSSSTAGTNRLTIDGLGTVGNVPTIRFRSAGAAKAYVGLSGAYLGDTSTDLLLTTDAAGASVKFGSSDTGTVKMTLDASGILLVGTTNSVIWNTTNQGCVVGGNAVQASRSNDVSLLLNRIGSNGKIAAFARQGLEVGDISVTTTGTTFNSTSDYRLKEDVQPLVGGLARVSALKPSIYKWKSNGSSGEGFLAHELAEVVPAAVSGEKDAVNEDGSIKAQSIDMSRVVPILVAAIQELAAEVNALKNA